MPDDLPPALPMSPFLQGFWIGLDHGRDGRHGPPPNPYPLRTPEREQWHRAYFDARALGRKQREEADAYVNSMFTTITVENK